MGSTPLDTHLEIVSERQRREIIHQLRDEPTGETTVADLVDQLSDGGSASTPEPPDRDQLSIQLVHNHLPKLDDHGIVHYDREHGVVRYQPDERIETVLDALPRDAVQTPDT